MKRWLIVLGSLAVIAALVGVGAYGIFSDAGTASDNTFTAGTLDLKIDDADNVSMAFTAENMLPGSTYNVGCVELKNVGTINGDLYVQVDNLVSNENDLLAPEVADGDASGVEVDPTGYDANAGDGELWDQITIQLCYDDVQVNGECNWNDTKLKGFSSTQDDYSDYYSIDIGTDLGSAYALNAGDSVGVCVGVKFIDDTSNSWWGGQAGLTNNMAMSDDAMLDLIFRLDQAP